MKQQNYFGFTNWAYVCDQFTAPEIDRVEPELVYAVYNTPSYEDSADVVFRRDGKWFHNNGCHCSCYGLEDQWDTTPLDTSIHLLAIANGKRDLCIVDTEGDFPEATQQAFDAWLAEAVLS